MKKKIKDLSIFVGPHEVAGFYQKLCEGFKQHRINYTYVLFEEHPFGYKGETSKPLFLKLARRISKFKNNKKNHFLKFPINLLVELLRSIWAIKTIFTHDVFIFGFGHSLMRFNLDLPLIKILGKKTISNLSHGSEARPPYLNGFLESNKGKKEPSIKELVNLSKFIKRRIQWHSRFCDTIICTPFCSQFLEKPFINVYNLGCLACDNQISIDPQENSTFKQVKKTNNKVRILHAPSHKKGKGTDLIINVIESLKLKGYRIDFKLLYNCKNSEVINEIKNSDFVIDQLFSDVPMAGFAAEAAMQGKCAIVGGEGLEELKKLLPNNIWPPSIICTYETLEEKIIELISYPEKRIQLGNKAKEFVEKNWSSYKIAGKYIDIILDKSPSYYWNNPKSYKYLIGIGQKFEKSQGRINSIINEYGISSLQLEHRNDLQEECKNFLSKKH